jgi:hypothetical protein
MLLDTVDIETNREVTIDTNEYGMPPAGAVALKLPEPGWRPRWITNHKEVQTLLWDGADVALLKPPAGVRIALRAEEHLRQGVGD